MANLTEIQNELQSKRRELQQELHQIEAAITALSGLGAGSRAVKDAPVAVVTGGRRQLSLGARRRIAAAQRARWAKVRAEKKGGLVVVAKTKRRVMSADARRRIAMAQKARWAKVRAQKKAA